MSRTLDGDKMLEEMKKGMDLWEKTKPLFPKGTDIHSRELYANTEGYFEALQDTIDAIEAGDYDA